MSDGLFKLDKLKADIAFAHIFAFWMLVNDSPLCSSLNWEILPSNRQMFPVAEYLTRFHVRET